jgi:hypothetical protein
MEINDPDLEILVSDNASFDDTEEMIAGIDDPRVRYTNTGARLSMRQNFEHALKKSTGDYVICHGDDDGILPGQFPFLRRILEEHKPDAMSWDYSVFGWSVDETKVQEKGFRLVRRRVFGPPQRLDEANLRKTLEGGQIDRQPFMPQLYHGCISRAYLDQLARADGEIILARSPDTYISYRAVQVGGHFLHCSHPFTMNGTSPVSNGGSLHRVGAKDPKARVKNDFESDIVGDPVKDMFPFVSSVPCGLLSTLETVRAAFPNPPLNPNFRSWYTEVILDLRKKDAETSARTLDILTNHATAHDCVGDLQAAQGKMPAIIRRLTKSWLRNRGKLYSLRTATGADGAKTMYDALRMCDALLSDDYGAVLSGQTRRAAAWSNCKARWNEGHWRLTPAPATDPT